MYSFAERSDTVVFDEPFYAFYLKESGKTHPGKQEILESQPHTYQEVFKNIQCRGCDLIYIKNMAHQMRWIPIELFEDCINILLIRNPSQLIASFAQVIDEPDMLDIGIADQHRIWRHFIELGRDVIVLDSGELVRDPAGVIRALCDRIEIPFSERMIAWKAGPRTEDGVWARYWYKNVHASTGFQKQKSSLRPFPEQCRELLELAQPLYKELYIHAIKAQ